jgi:hypothetical protein
MDTWVLGLVIATAVILIIGLMVISVGMVSMANRKNEPITGKGKKSLTD